MNIADNTCTTSSAPTVVPTQDELTVTIAVLLASAAAVAQPEAPSTYKPTFSAVIDPYLKIINLTTREEINTYKMIINRDHACIR